MFAFRFAKNAFSSSILPNRRDILASLAAAVLPTTSDKPPLQFGIIGTGNRGTSLIRTLLHIPNVRITALCDLDPAAAARAAALLPSSPTVFSGHPEAYRKLLERKDVTAILIATPEPLHAQMAIHSLHARKRVLSEVAAATSIEDCWRLVEAAEATRGFYMMAENCCYYPQNLMVANMVSKGIFGDLTLAECGYVHRLLERHFTATGDLSWRGQLAVDFANWYPTHAVGPVAQWFGINRGDRFATIASAETSSKALRNFAQEHFPQNTKSLDAPFHGDSTVSLIQTANRRLITNRFDVSSTRPTISTTYYTLQGTKGSYRDVEGEVKVFIEGRSPAEKWETDAAFDGEFGSPLWKEWGAAAEVAEHGGSDYITLASFIRAVQENAPSPINVYDAVTWSAVIPLSTESVKQNWRPLPFPDFTRGHWR